MSKNKLILIGVTGSKSGGALVKYMLKHMDNINSMFPGGITVICRESSNTEKIEKYLPNAEIKRGNLTDSSFMRKALVDGDTVVHIAGIHWSRNIIDAAVFSHVRRLILVHTTGIYSKYKKAGEEYRRIDAYVENECKKYNIILTILRPTMIYGNISDMNVIKFISMVDKLPIMPVVNGAKYELQPVHYEDLAKAYFDVLMNESVTAGKNYILSGGEVIQLRDMLTIIGDNLGKKVKFANCPYKIAYIGAWAVYILSFKKTDYREKVQRLCEPRVYDHNDATKDFGYHPRSFCVGVVDEVKEYMVRKKVDI